MHMAGLGGELDQYDILDLKNSIMVTIIENQIQSFFQKLDSSSRLYKEIKSDFLREGYLNSKLPFNLIRVIARTRCESTPCLTHQFIEDKICRFCNLDFQTVEHILYSCPFFLVKRSEFKELNDVKEYNIRQKFICTLKEPLKQKGWIYLLDKFFKTQK